VLSSYNGECGVKYLFLYYLREWATHYILVHDDGIESCGRRLAVLYADSTDSYLDDEWYDEEIAVAEEERRLHIDGRQRLVRYYDQIRRDTFELITGIECFVPNSSNVTPDGSQDLPVAAYVEVAPACADLLETDDTPSVPLVGLVGCIECLSSVAPCTPCIASSSDIVLSVAPFCADRLETDDVQPALLTVGFLKRIMCLSSLVLVAGLMHQTLSVLSSCGRVYSLARFSSPLRPLPAPPYLSPLGYSSCSFYCTSVLPFPVKPPDPPVFTALALPGPDPPYGVELCKSFHVVPVPPLPPDPPNHSSFQPSLFLTVLTAPQGIHRVLCFDFILAFCSSKCITWWTCFLLVASCYGIQNPSLYHHSLTTTYSFSPILRMLARPSSLRIQNVFERPLRSLVSY